MYLVCSYICLSQKNRDLRVKIRLAYACLIAFVRKFGLLVQQLQFVSRTVHGLVAKP